MADEPKIIGMGTKRVAQSPIVADKKRVLIKPATIKGHKDQCLFTFVLDWNGELHTVHLKAPISIRQALTGIYWAELSAKVCTTLRAGLANRARH